ncbi:MAG: beta-N-acetylhexosaminidase [Pseudomonadota bacterium]|nr:beta-N-acetylhexosaminidase [Pseudomonadota bacterium]
MSQPLAVGVIADIDGLTLSDDDRTFLQAPELSGLILFTRNYESPQQLAALTADIRSIRPDLLICVDQEGGRVQRFREGFTRFAPMMTFERLYQVDPERALHFAEQGGYLLAQELVLHGVDLTFAPVLDIERDCSQVIGDRAFGHDEATVAALAAAWCRGLARAGMKAVGKHFPGHGAVVADSHVSLPVDERSYLDLEYDMRPFVRLMAQDLLQGIMPAHVIYPAVDAERTAGFSARWLQGILRGDLGFDGVIFSDDLSMAGAAATGSPGARANAAMAAGANALVVCNHRAAAQEVIDAVASSELSLTPLSLQHWQPVAGRSDDGSTMNHKSDTLRSELEAIRTELEAQGLIHS